jgi:predicted O-methyltransferase YrrM
MLSTLTRGNAGYNKTMFGGFGWLARKRWLEFRIRLEARRIAQDLARSPRMSFTQDWVSGQCEQWRRHLARFAGHQGVRMLEIGSYEGRSAAWFLDNVLTHSTARLVCVDPFNDPRQEARFDSNVKVCGAGAKVEKRKGRSELVIPELERESFDVIYVDGSHEAPNVMLDAMVSWELLKPGGVLIFDDYDWEVQLPAGLRPQLAIDLLLKSHLGKYEVLEKGHQVAIAKKRAGELAGSD